MDWIIWLNFLMSVELQAWSSGYFSFSFFFYLLILFPWLVQASAEDIFHCQSAQAQRWEKALRMFTHLDKLLNEEGGAAEKEILQVCP